jgi:hypothetical protein
MKIKRKELVPEETDIGVKKAFVYFTRLYYVSPDIMEPEEKLKILRKTGDLLTMQISGRMKFRE